MFGMVNVRCTFCCVAVFYKAIFGEDVIFPIHITCKSAENIYIVDYDAQLFSKNVATFEISQSKLTILQNIAFLQNVSFTGFYRTDVYR